MSAITGRWVSPNKGISQWAVDWMYTDRWTSPRKCLAQQLQYIKKNHGRYEAKEFRNYLLWIGVYPTKR